MYIYHFSRFPRRWASWKKSRSAAVFSTVLRILNQHNLISVLYSKFSTFFQRPSRLTGTMNLNSDPCLGSEAYHPSTKCSAYLPALSLTMVPASRIRRLVLQMVKVSPSAAGFRRIVRAAERTNERTNGHCLHGGFQAVKIIATSVKDRETGRGAAVRRCQRRRKGENGSQDSNGFVCLL